MRAPFLRRCIAAKIAIALAVLCGSVSAGFVCELAGGEVGGDRIPLIFYAAGYTQAEKNKYDQDVQDAIALIRRTSPFREYIGHLAFFQAWTPSLRSGISDSASDSTFLGMYWKNKYPEWSGAGFYAYMNDSNYQCTGRDQSFVLQNPGVVLLNEDRSNYGANAANYRWVAVGRRDLTSSLMHELGHAMGALSDEYSLPSGDPKSAYLSAWDPMGGIRHQPVNVWNRLSVDSLPWKSWLSDVPIPTPDSPEFEDSIGLFEGADYFETGRFRPARRCLMRATSDAYCKVCREALVARFLNARNIDRDWVYAGATGMDTVFPPPSVPSFGKVSIVSGGMVVVRPISDSIASQKLRWRFNGRWLTGVRETLDVAMLAGTGRLEAYLETTSPYIRSPERIHLDTLSWSIEHRPGSTAVLSGIDKIRRLGPGLFLVPTGVAIPSSGHDAQGRAFGLSIVGRTAEGALVGAGAGAKLWIDPR